MPYMVQKNCAIAPGLLCNHTIIIMFLLNGEDHFFCFLIGLVEDAFNNYSGKWKGPDIALHERFVFHAKLSDGALWTLGPYNLGS